MTIAVSDLTGSLTGILKEDYDLDIEKEERLKEKYELQFTILISQKGIFQMKRLKLCLLALIICFGLCGCEGIGFTSIRRYADCMNRNWHLNLPETDVEIYVKDSGASFTGDGIRYHILQYDEESADIILKSFDWEAGELDSELADKMEEWLDSIDVPLEDRPKQNEWKHTTLLRKEDTRDHLIMFFDEDTNQLYVVEYFL